MLGEWMTEMRLAARLSGVKVSQQLGITRQAISNWERDRRLPTLAMMDKWCAVVGLTPEQIQVAQELLRLAYEQRIK